MTDNNEAAAQEGTQDEQQFVIQRIYTKDVSFEAPNSPVIFTQDWKPETNLQLNTTVNPLGDDNYEVELTITVTVKSGDSTAFLVEVNQAGVFFIQGYEADYKNHLLASYCPTSLFPYCREAIASMVSKGGFPEMHLSPINFDALYAQRLQQEQEQQETQTEA
jgi:preprotein translocase subunit SecB